MLGCSRLLYYYQFWNLFNFSFPDWQWQRKMTEKSRELEERSREFKDGKGFCKYYCIYSCKFIFTYTKNTVSLFFCGGMFCCCFCFYFIICLSVGSEVRSHLCLSTSMLPYPSHSSMLLLLFRIINTYDLEGKKRPISSSFW